MRLASSTRSRYNWVPLSYNAGLFVVRARAPWEPRRSFHPCRGEPCTLPTTGHRPSGRAYLARKTTLPANRTRPRTTRLRGLIGCQLRRTFWISSCPSWQHSLVGGKIFERRGVGGVWASASRTGRASGPSGTLPRRGDGARPAFARRPCCARARRPCAAAPPLCSLGRSPVPPPSGGRGGATTAR